MKMEVRSAKCEVRSQGLVARVRLWVISAVLGLRGREERWPGMPLQWAFTNFRPGPMEGITFYLPAGSSLGEARRRWREKVRAGLANAGRMPALPGQTKGATT